MENTDETFDKHIPRLDVDVVEEWNLAKCVTGLEIHLRTWQAVPEDLLDIATHSFVQDITVKVVRCLHGKRLAEA